MQLHQDGLLLLGNRVMTDPDRDINGDDQRQGRPVNGFENAIVAFCRSELGRTRLLGMYAHYGAHAPLELRATRGERAKYIVTHMPDASFLIQLTGIIILNLAMIGSGPQGGTALCRLDSEIRRR